MRGLRHVPISYRLTLAFAVAMTVVLAATGSWIYDRQEDGSRAAVRERLTDRQMDAETLLAAASSTSVADRAARVAANDAGVAQVFSTSGELVASSARLGDEVLASPSRVREASSTEQRFTTSVRDGSADPISASIQRHGSARALVVVVAEPQHQQHEAMERLAVQLAVGGGIAVLLGSGLALLLARAALIPVEELRAQAAIRGRAGDPVALPVPSGNDEVSRLATTLNELLGRMHDATLRERTFVAEAGHELRTPVATIIAELELALESRPGGDVGATLESLLEEAGRLAVLGDQLLQVAGSDTGLELRDVDLVALVAQRVARAATRGRTITFDADDARACAVPCDAHRVTQAIDNLIDNAFVHGGDDVQIRIDMTQAQMAVHVIDDGLGLGPDIAHRAFDRFARADDARARRGSGLGLSIVREIATAHGGSVGIGDRDDHERGTDAWFSLARAPADGEDR